MSLLKKTDKAKPLKVATRGGSGGTVSAQRPQQATKLAPCLARCPAGNDVRGWLNAISQHGKVGASLDAALDAAFATLTATNPLPACLGRVCPHPCETDCNRKEKDGRVGINSVEQFLGNYANINIVDQLTRVTGIASVTVFGAGQYAMRCWVRPDMLAKLNITIPEIVDALQKQNTVNPAGQVGGEPSPPGQEFTYAIRAQGRLVTPEDFGQIVLRANPDGSIVRVKDVGYADLGRKSYALSTDYQGKGPPGGPPR